MNKRNLFLIFLIILLGFMFNCKKEQVKETDENINNCTVIFIDGKAFLTDEDFNNTSEISIGDELVENNIIKTDTGSTVELQIGDESVIRIKENSIIKIAKLFKDMDIENTNIQLNVGKILAKPEKLTEGSSFEVEADTITAGVRGTEFTVYKPGNEKVKIAVNEGKVYVKKKISADINSKIEEIKKIDSELGESLEKELNEETIINKNEKIEVENEKYKEFISDVSEEITKIAEDLSENKGSKEKIAEIKKNSETKTVNTIAKLSNNLLGKEDVKNNEWEEEFNKKEFKEMSPDKEIQPDKKSETNKSELNNEENSIEKETEIEKSTNENIETSVKVEAEDKEEVVVIEKVGNLGFKFSEFNTAITQSDEYLYIASDENKKVYCIDPDTSNIKWYFTNPNSSKVYSPAIYLGGGNVLLATYNNIYVINSNGKAVLDDKISQGPSYWASPVISKFKTYIPTSRYLYVYNGSSIDKISEDYFPKVGSQIYISSDNTSLFAVESLNKNVIVYNLNNNKIEWNSNKLQNIVFTPPIKVKKHLIVADSKDTIYRFDLASGGEVNDTLNISTGVISNMVSYGSNIYFVAQNGWFYQVNTDSFNNFRKIIKVDNRPSQDKYLTKKILKSDTNIFYGTDSGKMFIYDLKAGKAKLYDIEDNTGNNPFVGIPVKISDAVYLIDTNSNVYKRYTTLR